MTNHLIHTNIFYILSGPSASGKSSLTKQLISQGLPLDSIISTDTIRKQILGSYISSDENGTKEVLHGWKLHQGEIFQIIDSILSIRFQQRLPTFFDATNLDDESRKKYVNLAKSYGIDSHIVIFNVPKEELQKRLSKRPERFDFSVVERQLEKFQLTSVYPYTLVEPQDTFTLLPHLLPTSKIDVIGDTHGLLDETILLLKSKGWSFINNSFVHSDSERRLLFLGDILDRGFQSIELLQAVYNTVTNGQGYFILGNHEDKLISSFAKYKKENIVRGKSLSSSQTLLNFLQLPSTEQDKLYQFLLETPSYYALWIDKQTGLTTNKEKNSFKIAFAHADNEFFNPYTFTRSNALYGNKSISHGHNLDEIYEKNYHQNINEYIYFRGHTVPTTEHDIIYSLEDDQAFSGHLMLLDLSLYIQDVKNNQWISTHQFFKDNTVKQKSNFDFNEAIKPSVELMRKMTDLVKNGLATDGWRRNEDGEKIPNPDGFKVYKYSKKVHFKRLWQTEPMLAKARGLVLDIAGNIVVHPFDKLYNYGEYDTGKDVESSRKVQRIDKMNGFLGCISKHPFREELLLSTTGSLNSPFVQYISDFIDDKTKGILLNYFNNNKQTLMFEVIHPDDPHIIEYESKDHGLWLIGARGLGINDKILTETQLDILGQKLQLKRPQWIECIFQDVLDSLSNSQLEGYMVRDASTNEPLMKIKTNYYLVTKFIGRTGDKMIGSMYKQPEKFKENHMDEEFYPIVDQIVNSINKDDFLALEQKQRIVFVRNIIEEQRLKVSKTNNFKIK